MDEEFFGEADDDSYERSMREREIGRLQRNHFNTGYADGVVMGREQSSQKGFDEGLLIGFSQAIGLGYLLGILKTIHTLLTKSPYSASQSNQVTTEISSKYIKLEEISNEIGSYLSQLPSFDEGTSAPGIKYLEFYNRTQELLSTLKLPPISHHPGYLATKDK